MVTTRTRAYSKYSRAHVQLATRTRARTPAHTHTAKHTAMYSASAWEGSGPTTCIPACQLVNILMPFEAEARVDAVRPPAG
eukprot:15136734-Alexandrium_andersonii.AAC.1